MNPILFPDSETRFDTLGFGVLSEATECTVTEERNGIFELEMKYPVSGKLFPLLINRNIIYAAVDADGRKEPFRIYRINRQKPGMITIYAAHLSYDLSGVVLSPFSAANAPDAMAGITLNSATENPFTFWTDKTTVSAFSVKTPSSVRSIMGGVSGSILDVYGGEYSYNKYTVRLHANRGTDRGVTIRYGKNLVDINQEENIQSLYTGVYPFWASEDAYVELPEKIVNADGSFPFRRIRPLDTSSEFDDPPTEDRLRSYAESFMVANNIGVPKVSISVTFVPLEQSEEYKNIAPLQKILLCDTVTVKFEALCIDATAKCVKTVFDVLKNRYKSVELGDARTNIADTIASQSQAIKQVSDPSFLQAAVSAATQLITGNKGGYVVLRSSAGGSAPDEILVMDTPDVNTATQVWRWNKSGLGYSSTGYNGPYALAITMDGKIVADFIATGTLNADQISVVNLISDKVKSTAGSSSVEISGAVFTMLYNGIATMQLNNSADGLPIMYIKGLADSSGNYESVEITNSLIKVGGTSLSPNITIDGTKEVLFPAEYTGKTKGVILAHKIGANEMMATTFSLSATQPVITLNDGLRWMNIDTIQPSGSGNCSWKYISSIGEYVLVRQ